MLFNETQPGLGIGGAKILPSEILGGGMLGVGNVYIVANTADTASYASLTNLYGGTYYPDGSPMLYGATSTTANVAIQAALDACVANRNDYVLVMPSNTNYGLAAALTMSKKGVHLICPTGLSGNDFAIGNTARIKQLGAYTGITISAQACEVAGFYCKNYADKSFITLAGSTYTGGSAGSASSPNIHHNAFMMVWSSSPDPIVMPYSSTDDGGSWGSISNNWFISETGSSVTSAIAAIKINAQATGCRVCHNEVTIGDTNTATLCIANYATKGHCDFNIFSDSYSANTGLVKSGTITNAIAITDGVCAIGNVGAVPTGCLLSGGTANKSFSRNYDAQAGGATPVEA